MPASRFLSPDGKTIAFASYQSGDLQTYTMNVDGSNQKALFAPEAGTAEQFYPEFSPDGKSLVFTSRRRAAIATRLHSAKASALLRGLRSTVAVRELRLIGRQPRDSPRAAGT